MDEIKTHLGSFKSLGCDDCCNLILNIDLSIVIFESKNRFYSSFDLMKGNMEVHVWEEAFQ